jgi:hypothetical protein
MFPGEDIRPEVYMRDRFWLLVVLLLLATTAAQQTSNPGKSNGSASPKAVGPQSIEGCLSGDSKEGYFLGTDTGDLYQVIGNNTSLHHFAGQSVRINGTVAYRKPSWSPSRVLATLPPTLTLSNIKKLTDTCD